MKNFSTHVVTNLNTKVKLGIFAFVNLTGRGRGAGTMGQRGRVFGLGGAGLNFGFGGAGTCYFFSKKKSSLNANHSTQ